MDLTEQKVQLDIARMSQVLTAVALNADACLNWLNRDEPCVAEARDAALGIKKDGERAAEMIRSLQHATLRP
jgi:hypothetical protein